MIDLAVHIERVARRLLGEPNKVLSTGHQLRFGNNGSIAVDICGPKRGEWYDHENQIGGSTREMLLAKGAAANEAGIREWFRAELGIEIDPNRQHIIKTYDYVDETGGLLFQVHRWGPKKTFSQSQPGPGKGGIKRKSDGRPDMTGVHYVPYHVDRLTAAKAGANGTPWRVYICEGEKDVDRLMTQWGLTASCNAMGAGKWRKDYGQFFIGAEAVVIADNDMAGRAHAAAVAAALTGVAAIVKLIELSGVPPKGDVSDWVANGGTQDDLETLVDTIEPYHRPPDDGVAPANDHDEERDDEDWGDPDLDVLRQHRRPPATLPLDTLGQWGDWVADAANASAAPIDYVAMPLLSSASALIGNARWARAAPGWAEPPHLWTGVVGDSGDSKSPGADCLMRDVLPEIERRMVGDFPDQVGDWQAAQAASKATEERWNSEVRDAVKAGRAAPVPPSAMTAPPEPQMPCLRQHDVTIERMANILATAAPKGLLVVRDELAGWVSGMTAYNDSGRSFWVESYGGRPFRVERQRNKPIVIPHLVVAVYGSTQPDKLAELMKEPDDGLLSRILWAWPDPIPFRFGTMTPNAGWAITAFDRLRELQLQPGDPPQPIYVSLDHQGQTMIEAFGRDMQERRGEAGGLLRSAFGKARGLALRLALVLEYLWWCAADGILPPPSGITPAALAAAIHLVGNYFLPMAERVYGDAGAPEIDRNAATLARWIR
jgi:hypothetical protein